MRNTLGWIRLGCFVPTNAAANVTVTNVAKKSLETCTEHIMSTMIRKPSSRKTSHAVLFKILFLKFQPQRLQKSVIAVKQIGGMVVEGKISSEF